MPSARDTAADTLTTTAPLLVLPCILAIPSGALLPYSSFFGGTLVFLLLCSALYALDRVVCADNLTVKTIEVQLLGVPIPLLAALSAISAVPELPGAEYLPMATNGLNFMLISIALTHLALLKRTIDQLNIPFLLGYSFALVVASIIGTGYIWARWGWESASELPNGFPTCVVLIYALAPLMDSMFRLRNKLPISTMETAALLVSFLGVAGCVASHFYIPALLPGLILASAVCFLLYLRLDHLEHQMRLPQELWTATTASHSRCHAALKALPVLTVGAWTAMGACATWAIREDARDRGARVMWLPLIAALTATGHVCIFVAVSTMREREPPLPSVLQFNAKTVSGIAAVVAIILTKVAIACYYLFCPYVTVPAWAAMTVVGSLSLLVAFLLDCMRTALLRYMGALLMACLGLGAYFLLTGVHLFGAHTETDAPNYLAIFLTGFLVCIMLVIYFALAMFEQDHKETKMKKDPAYFSNADEQSGLISTATTIIDTLE